MPFSVLLLLVLYGHDCPSFVFSYAGPSPLPGQGLAPEVPGVAAIAEVAADLEIDTAGGIGTAEGIQAETMAEVRTHSGVCLRQAQQHW